MKGDREIVASDEIAELRRENERLRIAERLALDEASRVRDLAAEEIRRALVHEHSWRDFGWPRHDLMKCSGCLHTRKKDAWERWYYT